MGKQAILIVYGERRAEGWKDEREQVEKSEKTPEEKLSLTIMESFSWGKKSFIMSLKIRNSGRTLSCAKGPRFPHQYPTHTHTLPSQPTTGSLWRRVTFLVTNFLGGV